MSLKSYGGSSFYTDRNSQYRSNSMILGRYTELWISDNLSLKPNYFAFQPFGVGNTQLSFIPLGTGRIYQGDLIALFDNVTETFIDFLIVNETFSYSQGDFLTKSFLPTTFSSLTELYGYNTGLIPIMSIKEGGNLDITSTQAEARNKVQGEWSVNRTASRSGAIQFTGKSITPDEGLYLLHSLTLKSRTVYYEIRYSPFVKFDFNGTTYINGEGPGAWEGHATISLSTSNEGDEFTGITCNMLSSGKPQRYTAKFVDLVEQRYCPLEVRQYYAILFNPISQNDNADGYCPLQTTSLYFIDFTLDVINDNADGYCPLETASLYTINWNPLPVNDISDGYCPLDRTAFYTINWNPLPLNDNADGYCPLDTTNLYVINYTGASINDNADGYCPLERSALYTFLTPP